MKLRVIETSRWCVAGGGIAEAGLAYVVSPCCDALMLERDVDHGLAGLWQVYHFRVERREGKLLILVDADRSDFSRKPSYNRLPLNVCPSCGASVEVLKWEEPVRNCDHV